LNTIYLICAFTGFGLLIVQMLLGWIAGDGHHGDVAAGHAGDHSTHAHSAQASHASWALEIFSLRGVFAGTAAFGFAGKAALGYGLSPELALALATVAAAVAMALVWGMLRAAGRIGSTGNVKIRAAIGSVGTVYISIPAAYQGEGKVQLDVMNRTLELPAVTQGEALSTGTRVRILKLVGTETVDVTAAI